MNITSQTSLYGLIGDPVNHSLSPIIHNNFFKQKDIDSIYLSFLVKKDNLQDQLEFLRNNLKGFNVTIPHKESIIAYLDEIHPLAREYGAVNTVKVEDNKLIGYNTDGFGFIRSLNLMNISLKDKKILLLGSGGAGRVAAFEILRHKGHLTIASRDIKKALALKEDLLKFNTRPVDTVLIDEIQGSFNIIINTTPLGMNSNINLSPVPLAVLQKSELVYDMIYNPYQSKFLSLGKESGAKTINGLSMLLHQGLKSLEIWTKEEANIEEINYLYQLLRKGC